MACVTNMGLACDAVPKMGDGLPKPACRSGLQNTRCCCVQKGVMVSERGKVTLEGGRYVLRRWAKGGSRPWHASHGKYAYLYLSGSNAAALLGCAALDQSPIALTGQSDIIHSIQVEFPAACGVGRLEEVRFGKCSHSRRFASESLIRT